MGGDKNMVGAAAPIPERERRRNDPDGGFEEAPGVSDRREAINGTEIAGDINRDEEEIGVVGIEGAGPAREQRLVNRHLRREQVAAASVVGEPIGVEFGWEIVNVDL